MNAVGIDVSKGKSMVAALILFITSGTCFIRRDVFYIAFTICLKRYCIYITFALSNLTFILPNCRFSDKSKSKYSL